MYDTMFFIVYGCGTIAAVEYAIWSSGKFVDH